MYGSGIGVGVLSVWLLDGILDIGVFGVGAGGVLGVRGMYDVRV